ncbi:helix-turn-helix domain-containing protein [Kamptonema cortianum]|nr:helix-turn-helix domain-containing protein [Kamptonema cortianum]MDL5046163.1 helix-turn-helix domain-containing protein [Oscillatoria amoena NRMC-F 0135]
MDTVGQKLKNQRQSRNLSLAAAAKATKIRAERLAEMEEDNFSKIAGLSYQREFLRTYAKFLKLDPHELVTEFNEQFGYEDEDYGAISSATPVRPVVSPNREVRLKPIVVLYSVIGVLILLVLLPVIVNLWRVGYFSFPGLDSGVQEVVVDEKITIDEPKDTLGTSGVSTNDPAQIDPETVTTNEPAPEIPAVKNRLAIRAIDDCWIRVTLDGQVDENDGGFILEGGSQKEFEAGKFTVEVFNPSLVMMLFNGQEVVGSNQGTEPKTITLP